MAEHSYFDLHVHSTDGSDDAGGTVEGYCKWVEAQRRHGYHVDGFVLTEHRRYVDDADYSALAEQYSVAILRGIEVETDVGHVLVYGVSGEFLEALRPERRLAAVRRRVPSRHGDRRHRRRRACRPSAYRPRRARPASAPSRSRR